MDKQFAVLGLGSFGSSVALTLENMGCDVLVVDESYEKGNIRQSFLRGQSGRVRA